MSIVVLAMHGSPPKDFPRAELSEFFRLPGQMQHATGEARPALEKRHTELEAKLRAWPRTAENDPYYAGSHDLAAHLAEATGHEVIVGFYEFCAPSLDEALDQAAAQGEGKVLIVTPMTTRGGSHSEVDIPEAVDRARKRHSDTQFTYVWPLDTAAFARFLAGQLERTERAY